MLHDMFALPFEEIAAILGRSPAATRQLASRARRRVQGTGTAHDVDIPRQRQVVDAFLSALRNADIEGLLAVLDPELVVHVDVSAGAAGGAREVRGAWAQGAVAFSRAAQFAQTALVNGAVGIILAPRGRLFRALTLTIREGRIAELDVIADLRRLRELDLAVLDDPVAPAE